MNRDISASFFVDMSLVGLSRNELIEFVEWLRRVTSEALTDERAATEREKTTKRTLVDLQIAYAQQATQLSFVNKDFEYQMRRAAKAEDALDNEIIETEKHLEMLETVIDVSLICAASWSDLEGMVKLAHALFKHYLSEFRLQHLGLNAPISGDNDEPSDIPF